MLLWRDHLHDEGRGLGVEVDVRVVCQAAQAGGIFTLLVVRKAGKVGVMPVDQAERLQVQVVGRMFPAVLSADITGENANARPADGRVGQQGVRVARGRSLPCRVGSIP